MFVVVYLSDLVFRVAFILISAIQLIVISGSKGVEHCMKTDANLKYDSDWLKHLAMT